MAVKWVPWAYVQFKPDCLFCTKKVHEAASMSFEGGSVAIRACESEECRKKAEETCEILAKAAS